ncbi:MAG: glutamate decarboxylase, partial [Gammaproteobacteria bacterium]
VPAYTMPPNAEEVAVLRVVVREGFSRDLANMLLDDLKSVIADLDAHPPSEPAKPAPQFKH